MCKDCHYLNLIKQKNFYWGIYKSLRLPCVQSLLIRHTKKQAGRINFPGASTQTPQGRLPPASQERGISPNLATLGASLYAPRGGECTHSHSKAISSCPPACRHSVISNDPLTSQHLQPHLPMLPDQPYFLLSA